MSDVIAEIYSMVLLLEPITHNTNFITMFIIKNNLKQNKRFTQDGI